MGLYVLNAGEHPRRGKIATLIAKHGAVEVSSPPKTFAEIPDQTYLVCVVDNGSWEAAGVAYDERQLARFLAPDPRPMTWLIVPSAEVEKLAPLVKGARESDAEDLRGGRP